MTELVSGYMEPDMQCRERADGANHDITTGNMLTVGFPHATARPEDDGAMPDPHWHQHLLIWNTTQRADGKILAGQFGNLIRDKPYYRAVFYSLLAKKLEGLGYAIDRRGGTEWEIAGVPQSMIDKFSKRTKKIEAVAEGAGHHRCGPQGGAGGENPLGQKQKELTLPELRQAWDGQLTDAEREALAAVYAREITPAQGGDGGGGGGLCHRPSQRKALRVPGAGSEAGGVALRAGQRDAGAGRGGTAATGRHHRGDRRRLMATTAELQREEDYIVGQAMGGQGRVAPVGVADGLDPPDDGRQEVAQ